ncbi:MAG TPA: GlxA family transcriptional regulator [Solirubrobacteraceae bacterium]|jgi:transcriptional regulator GlxA family with amidase domain|nr:GlxA family transcriptional regulator [Solirubrobacteraceae bacterium]
MPPIRRVLVLAVDGAQSLDVMGPVEIFHYADRFAAGSYRVEVVGPTSDGQITMSNGIRLGVEPLPEPPPRHDTLLVAGGEGARSATDDPALVDWIARASRRARRTTSVCTGSYLLAAAGLLDGRRATTHWAYCDGLAKRYPAVELDPDPVFIRDGDIWTSAGVTAGMDLALALVEDDLGAEVALAVARVLVVFLKRPGGQSQFSGALSAQQATRPALRELQAWIAGHLDEDLSVATLATRANLSERSFARAFRAEVGQTPAAYVEKLRVERARTLLEDGAESLEAVARAAGFSSPEVLRRAFHRRVGVGPAAYRERFRLAA